MNYIKIYQTIVARALLREKEGYHEKHHILPRCMGGTDDKSNLVYLTAREHYICHWLLAKAYNEQKLWAAFAMMIAKSDRHSRLYKNSRVYERARIAMSKAMTGLGNPMYGKISAFKGKNHTKETIEKIKLSKLGKKRNKFSRKPPSDETRAKISEGVRKAKQKNMPE